MFAQTWLMRVLPYGVALTPQPLADSMLHHQVIQNGHSKLLDAWGASGGMPRVKA